MINFVVNTRSGRGRGQKTLATIIDFCFMRGLDYTVHITASPAHATEITRALCSAGATTVVAVGGDGTFHEVLNGMDFSRDITLGFVPCGRGNDFASALKLPKKPKKALEMIARGQTRQIDYIEVGGRRCLNAAGTGLDIDVLQRVNGRQGKITYIKSLIASLKSFEPYRICVESEDGAVTEYESVVVGVCNGSQIGGGMKISPLSCPFDGLMNVVIIKMPKNQKILKLLPKFVKGKHLALDLTTHYLAKSVKITAPYPVQLDGEIYHDLNFDCKIVSGGIKTFA